MQNNNSLATPLKKAKKLGAAKSAVPHFIHQRLSAIILIPLVIFMVSILVDVSKAESVKSIMAIIASPINNIVLILFVITGIYHGMLGIKVIIEDYVSCEVMRNSLIIASYIISYFTMITAIVSLLMLQFKLI